MAYRVLSPETVTIGEGVEIGEGAIIFPNNYLFGSTKIGAGAVLYPNNILEDTTVGDGASVTASVARGAVIGRGAEVGPFANLRSGANVGTGCRVGDFVEIKNASIGAGSKVSHLAYVGDAEVGKNCNIGCGAVFCNYDGAEKHRTRVENNCFIGSNVNLVAPLNVGEGSYIAAGTTVAKDVPARSFVIGRARQELNETLARKYLGRGAKK